MSTPSAALPAPRRTDDATRARPRLRVAPEVARRRLRARLLMWGAALVTVASMFLLVAFHVFAAQSAFTLDQLAKERTNEQYRYERLRNEVATRSSAQSVIAAAHELGMIPGNAVVPLQAPAVATTNAATPAPVNDAPPAALSPTIYGNTKKHLAP